MSLHPFLTTAELRALFAEEITAAGGTVSDTFDDGTCLFARSILPQVREVRKADRVQGGVALRARDREVWVHPYLFRVVCSNGAILAHAVQTRYVEGDELTPPEVVAEDVRAALRACCAADAFTVAVEAMRSASEAVADMALNLLPVLSRLPPEARARVLRDVTERFYRDTDRSRFALLNAMTSVARDTRDPELRWRLEECGGAILLGRPDTPPPDEIAAEPALATGLPDERRPTDRRSRPSRVRQSSLVT